MPYMDGESLGEMMEVAVKNGDLCQADGLLKTIKEEFEKLKQVKRLNFEIQSD